MNEIEEKIKAQAEFCKKMNYPHFAPGNGICCQCKKQIYNYIDYERAANSLITGCPICFWSYCD